MTSCWLAALLGVLSVLGFCAGAEESKQATAVDANRLAYLDGTDPFYVGRSFPKLVTPQWVGEEGVEAVAVLAIDDMRDPQRYESFLRPILERLKQIDGRASVSIMCNAIEPEHPQLQAWLKEGLSLEAHTLAHPCPLLSKSNFVAASETYHECVERLNQVTGNRPVAFRMPCCDSMNSPSPRFYAEIFNGTNRAGQFLAIDSSVMNIFTSNDPSMPRQWVMDQDGREKFRKYVPFPSFVTTIEDYPYPYVIGRLCWEFPGVVPSDWEAQNFHRPNNPATVADWKGALDITVKKQGTFNLIFHPHGWIGSEQIVELIDYAVGRYGRKIKFLNFREAEERLTRHLLGGRALRASSGEDNGIRLVDLNADGYLDVIGGNEQTQVTRVWRPEQRQWLETSFPARIVQIDQNGKRNETGVKFGVLRADGSATMLLRTERESGAWHFENGRWVADGALLRGLEAYGEPVFTSLGGRDQGVRFRDLDRDGRCELIVGNEKQNAILSWAAGSWKKLSYGLPAGVAIVDRAGADNGLRFVDLNGDGKDDLVHSNPERFSVHLFVASPKPHLAWEFGWSLKLRSGKPGEAGAVPMIVRGGEHRDNGAWFHSDHLWIQNEETAQLPDKVDRRSFAQLLAFDSPPPKSAEESLRSIAVRSGFQVELVAAEPMVKDPIAFEWGPDGKLWVAEMGDYPLGLDGKGKPGGIVRFLEDTDDDGRYDRSTVFMEGLNFPTGVMPWRKGVLVSAAPEIFYAEDTNGDGRADLRVTLMSGFKEGNQQHRVNGFEYGLDNWVYAANGDSGGNIKVVGRVPMRSGSPSHRNQTKQEHLLNISGRDLRFRPDEGLLEAVAGQTQFGRHRDDWGNWFGNNNPNWLWHYYFPEQYLVRNPHLAVPSLKQITANYPNATRVYSISRPLQRFNWPDMINILTSANSVTPYRDDLFGPEYARTIFISEPANNLVHREVLEPEGVTFRSHRAAGEETREFVASTDNWFRPTMLKTGPDGALYIADMYRLVIEHVEYALPGMEQQIDLRAGDDKGRIYRVYPAGLTLRKTPRLDQWDTARLVQGLESANGWQRDTAQRLLVHSADPATAPLLERLITRSSRAKTRLQALCALEGIGGLTTRVLLVALKDSHPTVREHAVRLSEPFLRGGAPRKSALDEALLDLADDPDLRIHYQLAFSLGEWTDARAGQALARLALRDLGNVHLQNAVLSSSLPHLETILKDVLAENNRARSADLLKQLTKLAVAKGDESSAALALREAVRGEEGAYHPWQMGMAQAMLETLDRRDLTLPKYQSEAGAELQKALRQLPGVFAYARRLVDSYLAVGAPPESDPEFLMAISLLARGESNRLEDIDRLTSFLRPQFPEALQAGALAALGRSPGAEPCGRIFRGWMSYSPKIRAAVLNLAPSRSDWLAILITAIETKQIPSSEIGAAQRQRVLAQAQGTLRERAAKLFSPPSSDRAKLIAQYQESLSRKGDPQNGLAIFRTSCASCHSFHGEGVAVGPDLSAISDRSPELFLLGILDPNQALEEPYVSYTAITKSNREISGLITAETANSISLKIAGGTEETILRQDLQQLTSSGLSMMPEGFEQQLTPQDLADLIAFLLEPPAVSSKN